MAHPRRVIPGETYLITRRCLQRAFRLRPTAETNAIFLYCLAFAASRTGVSVHAVCVMSNHHHAVVTDSRGVLPEFLRELHRLSAKAINASQGQWENLWAAEPCNAVRLTTDEDVEDKIAYVVANPVAAGLVRRPHDWPGVLLWGDRTLRVLRPGSYFREDGVCPPELSLKIGRPPSFGADGETKGASDWRARVSQRIAEKIAAAHRALYAEGRSFLGKAAVVAASFAQRARSHELRFGLIPTFAARSLEVRDRLRRLEKAFRTAYREAFARWRGGEREEVFPAGTWSMVVVHGARATPANSSVPQQEPDPLPG